MSTLEFGLVLAAVGFGGTLTALVALSFLIRLLTRALPVRPTPPDPASTVASNPSA